jgi:Uncharacterized conserved protein (DUF2285)
LTRPSVNPGPVADEAPTDAELTDYDRRHLITYMMLLDAIKDGIDRDAIVREVLQIDPAEKERAARAFNSHLARAHWMTAHGYRHLLAASRPRGKP